MFEYFTCSICLIFVVQEVKPLLIGYSACWANGLMAVAGLGSNPGLEGGFSARIGYQACYEIKYSDRHREFACVLIKL